MGFMSLIESSLFSWKSTGKLQKTLAGCIEQKGITLHSGKSSTVKILPESAGKGRYFVIRSQLVPAFIDYAEVSPLCTTLCEDGYRIRTVEHLLSALEATGVDNCRIEINNSGPEHSDVEVPILDGSAKEWVKSIQEVGLEVARDQCGNSIEKLAAHVNEPVYVWRNDSFVAAFPSQYVAITYGIDFPQAPAIGCQWFSSSGPVDESFYVQKIAASRTFCISEEVEKMRNAGLVKGGSLENAIVCSATEGWLNPPLHFHDEPCRHKVLDLIGDVSLFSQFGNQGLPVANIFAYKGGHALHIDFVRRLLGYEMKQCLLSACQESLLAGKL